MQEIFRVVLNMVSWWSNENNGHASLACNEFHITWTSSVEGDAGLFHSVKGIRGFVRLAYPLEVPFWIPYDFTCFKNLTRTEDFKRTENWAVHYTTEEYRSSLFVPLISWVVTLLAKGLYTVFTEKKEEIKTIKLYKPLGPGYRIRCYIVLIILPFVSRCVYIYRKVSKHILKCDITFSCPM